MPIQIPNVTGWAQPTQENISSVYDPFAGIRNQMEIARFMDERDNARMRRVIQDLQIKEILKGQELSRGIEDIGRQQLMGLPTTQPGIGTGNVAPNMPNAFAPPAHMTPLQAPTQQITPQGPVNTATLQGAGRAGVQQFQAGQQMLREAALTRQKKQEDTFETNMAKSIETGDFDRVKGMASFYAKYSDNPYLKSKAADIEKGTTYFGGGDFTQKRYFSKNELDQIRASLPSEKSFLVPANEGFYEWTKKGGRVSFPEAHASDDELADMSSNSADPQRQAWAKRVFETRNKAKNEAQGFTTTGVTAKGGTVSSKGGKNYYWDPSMGDNPPVPWDQNIHGKILPKTESYVERIQKGEDFIGTPVERQSDVSQIRAGQLDANKIATGGGMGGYGMAYSRQIRQDVHNAQQAEGLPDFNYVLANQNYKYMENPNTLRSIGLSRAVLPRVYAMEDKIDKIQNKFGSPILDMAWNKIRKDVLGDVGLTDYESLRNDIIQEVNTALSGTSVSSDARLGLELERLKSSATPQQLKIAIGNLKSALQARIDSGAMIPNPWEVVRGEIPQKEWFTAMAEGRDPKDIRGNTVHIFGIPGTRGTETVKSYTQADIDTTVKAHPGTTAKQVEDALKAKGWTKR